MCKMALNGVASAVPKFRLLSSSRRKNRKKSMKYLLPNFEKLIMREGGQKFGDLSIRNSSLTKRYCVLQDRFASRGSKKRKFRKTKKEYKTMTRCKHGLFSRLHWPSVTSSSAIFILAASFSRVNTD